MINQNSNWQTFTVFEMQNKPKGLTCHICAGEFGTTSIAIHIPQCMTKWLKRQEILPPNVKRRTFPPLPSCPIPASVSDSKSIELYNQEAFTIYSDYSLNPCTNCGKKFAPESLLVHSRSCKAPLNSPIAKKSPSTPSVKGKRINSNALVSKSVDFSGAKVKTPPSAKRNPLAKSVDLGAFSKPIAVPCHLCGREFGISSIEIHIPQCSKKWLELRKTLPFPYHKQKLPKGPTSPVPVKESETFPADLEKYTQEATSIFEKKGRVVCKSCHRSFDPDPFLSHLKSCSGGFKEDRPPGARPKMFICYICGREYGSTSLLIHQKKCIEMRQQQQEQLPPHLRTPLPKPPSDIPISKGKMNLDEFNDEAFSVWKESLVECENCGRKFLPDRLQVHLKSCKPGSTSKRVHSTLRNSLKTSQSLEEKAHPHTITQSSTSDTSIPIHHGASTEVTSPTENNHNLTRSPKNSDEKSVNQKEKKSSRIIDLNEIA